MGKRSTIDAFFKKKVSPNSNSEEANTIPSVIDDLISEECPSKTPRIESKEIDMSSVERDPGLRHPIWEYDIDQRDEIRSSEKHLCHFHASWFNQFRNWLEYSPTKDAAFCLRCYIFSSKPNARFGADVFTIKGFQNWKKVNDGKNCAFLGHIGKSPNSPHNFAMKFCDDLMAQSQHIDKVLHKQSSQQIAKNRLRLKASIDAVRWLTFQGCAFRGNDEGSDSINRENFIEMVKILASYNEDVSKVVLENAPKNAQYIAPSIQKEILHVVARKIRCSIREEIGNEKFCVIVDEAQYESKKEQMAIVLRFVDKYGFIQERFFDIVHVADTLALTLKNEISSVFYWHNLDIQNLRGQGYDGASNMRGEWNGLQALFQRDCPYAYYVHCFAHRLQLALIAASREVIVIHQFFTKLMFIVNIVGGSYKRHDELKATQVANIANMIAIDELETGTGLNQIGTLQRAGDTRWSSHLNSIRSLVSMFDATCLVLKTIIREGIYSQCGDADAAHGMLTSFEFIFNLHLMREILGITDDLCQALQRKSQDILNAMNLVSTTKTLIQKLRESGWDDTFQKVKSFCERHDIDVLDMSAQYLVGRGRSRCQENIVDMCHHYKIDIFTTTIDTQLQELNNRFNESSVELLILSYALDPRDNYKFFKIDDICRLASNFYPSDFTEQEKLQLRLQLQHYELNVPHHSELKNLSTISELCQG